MKVLLKQLRKFIFIETTFSTRFVLLSFVPELFYQVATRSAPFPTKARALESNLPRMSKDQKNVTSAVVLSRKKQSLIMPNYFPGSSSRLSIFFSPISVIPTTCIILHVCDQNTFG